MGRRGGKSLVSLCSGAASRRAAAVTAPSRASGTRLRPGCDVNIPWRRVAAAATRPGSRPTIRPRSRRSAPRNIHVVPRGGAATPPPSATASLPCRLVAEAIGPPHIVEGKLCPYNNPSPTRRSARLPFASELQANRAYRVDLKRLVALPRSAAPARDRRGCPSTASRRTKPRLLARSSDEAAAPPTMDTFGPETDLPARSAATRKFLTAKSRTGREPNRAAPSRRSFICAQRRSRACS